MSYHDGKLIEKEMADQGVQTLRDKTKALMLNEEVARQLGIRCRDCGSKSVVYAISKPIDGFPAGAYCYKDLLKRCRWARMIPFPMPENLLNNLKRGLGIPITQAPIIIQGRSLYPEP